MKYFITLLVATALLSACKKEKTENTPTPVVPAAATKDIALKLDGVASDCSSCSYSTLSGTMRGITFNLPSSKEPMILNFMLRPLPGIYALVEEDFTYKNHVTFSMAKDNTYYSAVTGTIHVTESDTTAIGEVKKLKATFSFKTDTINGKFYNVTEGVINFTKK